jgi:DNA-directed RNA polymerase specialized sigma24 family protein
VSLLTSAADPDLAAAIRALPPRRRLIVFLRYFADLPYDAIAELAGITPGRSIEPATRWAALAYNPSRPLPD